MQIIKTSYSAEEFYGFISKPKKQRNKVGKSLLKILRNIVHWISLCWCIFGLSALWLQLEVHLEGIRAESWKEGDTLQWTPKRGTHCNGHQVQVQVLQ